MPEEAHEPKWAITLTESKGMEFGRARGSTLELMVRRANGELVGVLGIGSASVTWKGAKAKRAVVLPWDRFATLLSVMRRSDDPGQ